MTRRGGLLPREVFLRFTRDLLEPRPPMPSRKTAIRRRMEGHGCECGADSFDPAEHDPSCPARPKLERMPPMFDVTDEAWW